MADTIFLTALPPMKAVDLGDGTYAVGAKLMGGALSDDIDLSGHDIENVGDIEATSITAPTGRTASWVIAPSNYDGPTQYDQKCDSVGMLYYQNDDHYIQIALNAHKNVFLLEGNFYTSVNLTFPTAAWNTFTKGVILSGSGIGTKLHYLPNTGYVFKFQGTAGNAQCANNRVRDIVVTAPNTTDAVFGFLGGALTNMVENVRVIDAPFAMGFYLLEHVTYGNNSVVLSNVITQECLYGAVVHGGGSLFIDNYSYLRTNTANGQESILYDSSVYATAGDPGFNQLVINNVELMSPAVVNTITVIGSIYLVASYNNLYTDISRPVSLNGGRHTFTNSNIGELLYTADTIVNIDKSNKAVLFKNQAYPILTRDGFTPLVMELESIFCKRTGTAVVAVDATASNGSCVTLSAQNDIVYLRKEELMDKISPNGKFMLIVYAKDSAAVANDFGVVAVGVAGGYILNSTFTLQATYQPIAVILNTEAQRGFSYVGFKKSTATANTISVDYMILQYLAPDHFQSIGGGNNYLYFPNSGTLPTASAAFRGLMGFIQGGAGARDSIVQCMKSDAGVYAWITVSDGGA